MFKPFIKLIKVNILNAAEFQLYRMSFDLKNLIRKSCYFLKKITIFEKNLEFKSIR